MNLNDKSVKIAGKTYIITNIWILYTGVLNFGIVWDVLL